MASLTCDGILAQENTTPVTGIIRFDAWSPSMYSFYENRNEVPIYKFLIPSQWHYRWPSFASGQAGQTLLLDEDNQTVIDQQIKNSVAAGINYWAFNWTNFWWQDAVPTFNANYGLKYYLSSPNKNLINFSLTLMGKTSMDKPDLWESKTVPNLIKFLKDPKYQKVLVNRPLIYIFEASTLIPLFNCNDYSGAEVVCTDLSPQKALLKINYLRQEVIKAGLANPYIVGMVWDPSDDIARQLGLDAISAYSAPQLSPQYPEGKPYSDLMLANKNFWEKAKTLGKKVIPIVNLGWDRRPHWTDPNESHNTWYQQASPTQITTNINNAVTWVKSNRTYAEANSILIYALNEHSEGGWLGPTLDGGNSTIEAVRLVLGPTLTPTPIPVVGDADGNGKVDILDFAIWKMEYLSGVGIKSDFSGDGKVSLIDFGIWRGEYLTNN